MKYIFVLLLFATSCGSIHDKDMIPTSEGAFKVITIDGCQYLYRASGYKGFMAHKGNCTQCVERQKQVCQVTKHQQL